VVISTIHKLRQAECSLEVRSNIVLSNDESIFKYVGPHLPVHMSYLNHCFIELHDWHCHSKLPVTILCSYWYTYLFLLKNLMRRILNRSLHY